MQAPFDLNLMNTNQRHSQREIIADAKFARQLEKAKAKSKTRASGWNQVSGVWNLLKKRNAV